MKKIICSLLILMALGLEGRCQHEKEELLEIFKNIAGGKWTAEGQWKSGQPFKQEIEVEMSLNSQLTKVKSYGFVDEQGTFGLRNEGIRAWDSDTNQMRFWAFDIYGGITEGFVGLFTNGFFYQYEYPDGKGGLTVLRDVWTKKNIDTYNFHVESLVDGKPGDVFLQTEFKREPR